MLGQIDRRQADPRALAWRGSAQRKRVGPHLFNPALEAETKSAGTGDAIQRLRLNAVPLPLRRSPGRRAL
jgi:hypothetical protein